MARLIPEVYDSPQGTRVVVAARLRGDEWLAVGVYMWAADGLRLAEMRVMPYEDWRMRSRLDRETWSQDTRVLEKIAPPHAIKQVTLRDLPLREMQQCAQRALDRHRKAAEASPPPDPGNGRTWEEREAGAWQRLSHRALLASHGADETLTERQIDYLETAAVYSRLPNPNWQEVADILGLADDNPRFVVRDRLKAARSPRYGYLQSPGLGSKRGNLTPRGEHLASIYLTKDGRRKRTPKARQS